ncbi:MAG TPA: GAF domain-containing protein, partial [Geminicoccus sp.]|uniref:GAF domain-containing protein n=1 Tax=Geminicoccus sp. TaxID=2024832 RepID=UPI002E31CA76
MAEAENPARSDHVPGVTGRLLSERLARADWTATSCGPPEAWPEALRHAVGLMQRSGFPMFVVWGPERTFLYNDIYVPILGQRHPQAFARPFFSVWPEVEEVIAPVIDAAFAGQESFFKDLEVTLTRTGAPERTWFTFSYSPIIDERGAVPGVLCVCVETTASVLARETAAREQQRAAEQAHVLEVLNATGAALAAELDLDRIVQMVTDAGVDITGAQFGAFFYNAHDEAGGSFLLYSLSGAPKEAFSKFPHPRATAVFAPTFKGEGVIRSDDITRDPRYGRHAPHHGMPAGHLPVRSYLAVPVVSRSGEAIGGLFFGHATPGVFSQTVETLVLGLAGQAAVAIDNARLYRAAQVEIARRRAIEDELRELNETLEQKVEERTRERDRIFQLSSDLFAIVGFDGLLKVVNPAWERLLGYSEHQLLARPFVELIHPDDHQSAADVVAALSRGEPIVSFEDRLVRADGTPVTVSWTAVPEGELFYAVGRDVTLEREREEQLRQAQKMEAIGQLTGGIAHDFNNLLTGILGSLELMQSRIRQGRTADVERFATAATTAANRAAALTHRLLAFSRRQPIDPKPTDANRL